MPTRRSVVVALPAVQALHVTGPADVFAAATERTSGDAPAYAIEVVGPGGAPIGGRGDRPRHRGAIAARREGRGEVARRGAVSRRSARS
jgi:hypothetical protein